MTFLCVMLGLCAEIAAVQVYLYSLVILLLQDRHAQVTATAEVEASFFSRRMTATSLKPSLREIASTKAVVENDAAQVESTGVDIASPANDFAL